MESKSQKEIQVEEKISDLVTKIVDEQTSGDDLPIRLWNNLRNNQEIAAMQEYANMVSIGRLGLNDHGPVHMKTVCRNALKMLIYYILQECRQAWKRKTSGRLPTV